MRSSCLRTLSWTIALAAACGTTAVQAQGTSSTSTNTSTHSGTSSSGYGLQARNSVLPYTQDGYIGLSGGRSAYSLNRGPAGSGLDYDDSGSAYKIYTGGFFHPNAGVEFGYLNAGKAHRLGGNTEAHGFNLSLVGRAPLGEQFDIFGKVGTTYGRTRTSGLAGTGVALGKDNGFGLSYGLGARWAFTPQWAAVIEWENHKLKFSDGKQDVKMTTVGLQYRF